MRNCKICRSLQRKKIDKDMLRGFPYSALEKKYKISVSTLRRHRNNHIPLDISLDMKKRLPEFAISKIDTSKDIPPLDNLLNCLTFIHTETLDIHKKAKDDGNYGLALQALKQDLECIGFAMKGNEIKMSYQAQSSWEKVLPKILNAVRNHKEARLEIAQALHKEDIDHSGLDDINNLSRRT